LYSNFVDHNFITTHPSVLKNKTFSENFHFFFVPVDKNIERFDVFKLNPKKDLFYAMSHGVNRAVLKKGTEDSRVEFLDKLVKKIPHIKYDFYGFANKQPIWGNDFIKAISNSSMAINLSRGEPVKYYSSDRIAQLIGNGLLTFIDKKTKFNDFFSNDEVIFYTDLDDLSYKLNKYKKDIKDAKRIAKNGRDFYSKNFNSTIVSDFILSKLFDFKSKNKFVWEN